MDNEISIKQLYELLERELKDLRNYKKQATAEIEQLETIISLMPGTLFWTDTKGIYLGCNNNLANIIKLPSNKAIRGKTIYDFLDKKAGDLITKADRAVMKSGKETLLEEVGYNEKGEEAYYLTRKVPLYNINHELTGVLGISIDVTEQKQTQKELAQAHQKLAQTAKTKLAFFRSVIHEVKNSLMGLYGKLQIAEMEHYREIDPIALLTEQKQAIANLNKKLDTFTALVQLENENSAINYEPIALTELIQSSLTRIEIKPAVKLLQHISAELPQQLSLPVAEIIGALQILIKNAAKYTAKGQIAININPFGKKQDSQLVIEVADTGIGMSQHQLANLFHGFSDTENEYRNANVKLATVKAIAERLGGRIAVSSVEGKGTQFELIIPYQPVTVPISSIAKPTWPDLPEESIHSSKHKLNTLALVVEDEEITRNNHAKMLTMLNWQVHTAATGKEAMKRLKLHHYSIILLDITLPDASGLAILKKIRALNQQQPHIVLAVTSHNSPADRERFLNAGFTEVIAKPFQFDELKEILDKLYLLL